MLGVFFFFSTTGIPSPRILPQIKPCLYLCVCVLDRLNLPSILVLDGCGITEAGDEEEVATFCAHVVELDLSHNQLKDWGEVRKMCLCQKFCLRFIYICVYSAKNVPVQCSEMLTVRFNNIQFINIT